MSDDSGRQRALKIVLPILATVAILASLAWLWQASRVAAVYSVMDMAIPSTAVEPRLMRAAGTADVQGHAHHSEPSRLVTDLVVDPARPARTGRPRDDNRH